MKIQIISMIKKILNFKQLRDMNQTNFLSENILIIPKILKIEDKKVEGL